MAELDFVASWTSLSTAGAAFLLVFLAEFGDKSQLVCMTLAARYRPWPVLVGAGAAFAILNLLAVVFGAALAGWIPELWLTLIVALLFGFFGIQSLLMKADDDDDAVAKKSRQSLLLSAFLMIFVAEFGDKTQLAVAGLGGAEAPLPVWLGATLALLGTTAIGVLAGKALLKRFSLVMIHRVSGGLFIALAVLALTRLF